jgi:hypothetical protein
MAAPSDGPTTCTICCETPPSLDTATLPACGHTFCASCVVSWHSVRPLCPNCKASFTSLFVLRDPETGAALQAPVSVDPNVLATACWISVTPLLPIVDDIAAAFTVAFSSAEERRRDHALSSAVTGVPNYACEEVEDAAEDAFWAAEERMYRDHLPSTRSTRVMANRRHGANGYLSNGHLVARPGAAAASSSAATQQGRGKALRASRARHSDGDDGTGVKEHKPPSSGGKRKKKVKKKSRIASEMAANAAAAAADDAIATFAVENNSVEGESDADAGPVRGHMSKSANVCEEASTRGESAAQRRMPSSSQRPQQSG